MANAVKKYDVVAFGALCVDIQTLADDEFLSAHGIKKSLSNPLSRAAVEKLASAPGLAKTAGSPGSNVAAGIAVRGGAAALIGKISADDAGKFFKSRVDDLGIDFMPLLSDNPATATTCVVVVTTPDKERSFAYYNGAGLEIRPEDVDGSLLAQAKIVYLDSYLWLSETGKATIHHAAAEAKKSGAKVALALNDTRIISENKQDILALAASHADILLGDFKEFRTLFDTTTIEGTAAALQKFGCIAAVTAGAKGAYAIDAEGATHVPTTPVAKVVDTNGAGDAFASGFLYGLSQGMNAADSASIGNGWAGEIIQHMGAEPRKPAPDCKIPPPRP